MRQNLGQHFLKDQGAIRAIVDALDIRAGDTVIEIGPGKGALTKEIFSRLRVSETINFKYIGIEKDPKLAEELESQILKLRVSKTINWRIVRGDARDALWDVILNEVGLHSFLSEVSEVRLHSFQNARYKIVGNIPYYLTGSLFRIIGELQPLPERIVLTVQREVAERVTAQPPRMNLLAASVQVWADVKIVMGVPRTSFTPPPDVASAILLLMPHGHPEVSDADTYYETVRTLFAHPRKTIRNNLADRWRLGLPEESKPPHFETVLRKIGVNPDDRPQNLSIDDIVRIAKTLRS